MKKQVVSIIIGVILINYSVACTLSNSTITPIANGTEYSLSITPTEIIKNTKTSAYYKTSTFKPTLTLSATLTKTNSLILLSGNGVVIAYPNQDSITMSYFDLDTGQNGNNVSSDIEFTIGCGSDCFPGVKPINGAKGLMIGSKEPKFSDCLTKIPQFKESIINFPIGYFFCILTNSGNISKFVFSDSLPTVDSSTKLELNFQTWQYK